MQVLKPEIRLSILNSARTEFEKFGYGNSSMRGIASGAGITMGNLYRYFPSKQDIFGAVVEPALEGMVGLVRHSHDDENAGGSAAWNTGGGGSGLMDLAARLGEAVAETALRYRTELCILLDGSRGTSFETAKETILSLFAEQAMEHIAEYGFDRGGPGGGHLARAMAASYMEGVLEILRAGKNGDTARKSILEFNRLYWTGFISLFTSVGGQEAGA